MTIFTPEFKRIIIISITVVLTLLLGACGHNPENSTEITEKATGVTDTAVNDDMMNEEKTNSYSQISMSEAFAATRVEMGETVTGA